ncbi:hypothetical protein [Haloarcula laminariae]|uniref:hypothetical protein n=1 Tax=Haloarcula laminariae TaxID=2961577 RepID=UPI0021C93F43|nr:hypothetical protein [Halomicroarcula laminariae]
MKREDDRILEYLDGEHWSTPSLIATDAFEQVSKGHVEERLLFLQHAELVAALHGDMYEITSEGRRYLDGELDASHQPTPTVERVLKG